MSKVIQIAGGKAKIQEAKPRFKIMPSDSRSNKMFFPPHYVMVNANSRQ